MEEENLSSTWPSAAVARRQQSSTLFHRTTGSSNVDATAARAAHDEEWGGGSGHEDDTDQDKDCLTPPRGARRIYNKRGAGISAARRNGALFLALCVSVASLVWIITRDTGGSPAGEFNNVRPWVEVVHSLGKKKIPATEGSEWAPADIKKGAGTKGHGFGPEGPLRGTNEYNRLREQMKTPAKPSKQHREKFKRWQPQPPTPPLPRRKQHDMPSTTAHVHVPGAATTKADGAPKQQPGEMARNARSEDADTAPASGGSDSAERRKGEVGGIDRRDEAGGIRGFPTRVAHGGGEGVLEAQQEGGAVLPAKRDAVGVGKWGLFEEVPTDIVDDKLDFEVRNAAFEMAASALKDSRTVGSMHGARKTREGLLPADVDWEKEPSEDTANVDGAALSGGGGGKGGGDGPGGARDDFVHLGAVRERATMSVAPGEDTKEEQALEQPGEGGSSGADEGGEEGDESKTEEGEEKAKGHEGMAKHEFPRERNKLFRQHPVEVQPPITKSGQMPPEVASTAAAAESVRSPSNSAGDKKGDRGIGRGKSDPAEEEQRKGGQEQGSLLPASREKVVDAGGGVKADALGEGAGSIREAADETVDGIRAGRVPTSTNDEEQAPAGTESKQPLADNGKILMIDERAKRADVRPPSRHAARWEQAKASASKKDAAAAPASSAAVAAEAQESAVLAEGLPAAQPAVEPSLQKAGQEAGDGLRGGSGGGVPAGGKGETPTPCRLEGRVEDWKPPATADIRSSYRWKDEQKGSMDRIRRFSQGGTALRDLIHAEVVALDILRHDLFC